jgi:2,3-dihydroxybiphenyl 1,2-dioxygenase
MSEDTEAEVTRLAYLGFEVSRPDAWDGLLTRVLGFAASAAAVNETRAYRMDEHERRILLASGPRDDIAFVGWEVAGRPELDIIVTRLTQAGVAVAAGTAREAKTRAVESFVSFADPDGIRTELCVGPRLAAQPFRSDLVPSGFVTGAQGMGHILILVSDRQRTERFYRDQLGFKLSDYVESGRDGVPINATFLHANPRHHSLAIAEGPGPRKLHHFMLEVGAFDDVGRAYDRCLDADVPIRLTIGRHENDQVTSFYANTPSGFAFEVGWGGRKIDDRIWKPTLWHRVSEWGHRTPKAPVAAV